MDLLAGYQSVELGFSWMVEINEGETCPAGLGRGLG